MREQAKTLVFGTEKTSYGLKKSLYSKIWSAFSFSCWSILFPNMDKSLAKKEKALKKLSALFSLGYTRFETCLALFLTVTVDYLLTITDMNYWFITQPAFTRQEDVFDVKSVIYIFLILSSACFETSVEGGLER